MKVPARLALAIGILGISSSAIFVRWAEAPAAVTAAWRLIFAVIILTPFVLMRYRTELKRLVAKDIVLCSLSGLCLALHFLSWFEALNYTTVASATVLVNTDVIFAALGFALVLKGHIPKLGIWAIVLAFVGSCIVALGTGGSLPQAGQLWGNALALAGGIFVSGYILIGRVQRGHLSAGVYTWLVYVSCMVCLLVFCIATQTPLLGWGARELGIGLWLAVVCTLMGHSVLSWCLKYLSPAYLTAAKLGEPLLAAVMAYFIFAELPAAPQFLGAALVLLGIFIFTYAENKERKKQK